MSCVVSCASLQGVVFLVHFCCRVSQPFLFYMCFVCAYTRIFRGRGGQPHRGFVLIGGGRTNKVQQYSSPSFFFSVPPSRAVFYRCVKPWRPSLFKYVFVPLLIDKSPATRCTQNWHHGFELGVVSLELCIGGVFIACMFREQ